MPSSPMRSTKYNYLALMADDGLLRVGGRPVDVDEHGCGRRRPCRRCRRHDNVRHAKGVVERRPPPSSIPPPRTVSTDNSGHSSRPTHASCRAGCRVASPHAAASHLPAPLIAASPFVPLVRPAGCHVSSLLTLPHPICQRPRLSSLSRHRLLSRPSQASHPAG